MSPSLRTWRALRRAERQAARMGETIVERPDIPTRMLAETPPVEIQPDDPILAFFQSAPGVVDIEALELESPAKEELRQAGVKLAVPLVSQGELIGALYLGPRLSQQEYSGDDRRLLQNLAAQAAPAVQVALLVRKQEGEIRERQRMEQELRVATLIQQNFLPKSQPELEGWSVSAHYRPAREVGGDFYDYIELSEGKLGLVVGDVTDKGVPAAMVMAATRSVLRATAQRLEAPSAVLKRVNDILAPDMPKAMFVTCLFAVLDPSSGVLRYANAGHNLPLVRTDGGVSELKATGMPLGLMPDMTYEEKEATLAPGHSLLLHSDGLSEAHDPDREMFGIPRLAKLFEKEQIGEPLIRLLLDELSQFTGEGWVQEDDITLVTLTRLRAGANPGPATAEVAAVPKREGTVLTEFEVASEEGNERIAMRKVSEAVTGLSIEAARLEKLKTAVAEATMNAIEHGNLYREELPVVIRVIASDRDLWVHITDQGGEREILQAEAPDLDAKLAGEQKARGWGLFLIQNMVDSLEVFNDGSNHTVELSMRLKGEEDGTQRA